MQEIDLADFLLVAEAILNVPAEELARGPRIQHAESALAAPYASYRGEAFYPDPVERAAILCSRIVRNHPLPDGNKRVAYVLMREALLREGLTFNHPEDDQEATADVIERLAARTLSEEKFVAWLKDALVRRPRSASPSARG